MRQRDKFDPLTKKTMVSRSFILYLSMLNYVHESLSVRLTPYKMFKVTSTRGPVLMWYSILIAVHKMYQIEELPIFLCKSKMFLTNAFFLN